MAVDPAAFKAVMGQWPSGVTVVTTIDGEGPHGMTASSFSSVSLEPPLVSVCIAKHLNTHDRLLVSGVFAVNILDKDQVDHGLRFAGMLDDVDDRFHGVEVDAAETGAPLLRGTLGWVDCKVWQAYDGGDHTIFVGEVLAAGTDPIASPLLYHSRSWGQFADVLASEAEITEAAAPQSLSTVVVDNAFGDDAAEPAPLDEVVRRIDGALNDDVTLLDDVALLVLDDRAGAADPVRLRRVLQALAGRVGRTRVALRPAAGPMALANVLVALKSGVHHLQTDPDGEVYVATAEVTDMLDRMGVSLRAPATT